jgi:endonuclease G
MKLLKDMKSLVGAVLVAIGGVFAVLNQCSDYQKGKTSSPAPATSDPEDRPTGRKTWPRLGEGLDEQQAEQYTGFALSYNAKHRQANWVAYELTRNKLETKIVERTNNFDKDPKIPNSPTPADYRGSGYDKGHLAPSADMRWSVQAQTECFYMTNMSPQVHEFNAGSWENLESQVRRWAKEKNRIQVVTGPVLYNLRPTKSIGKNKDISVPREYYKVILFHELNKIEGIGFIMRNEESTQALNRSALSIDEVEKRTGIDFFSYLPDHLEDAGEQKVNLSFWFAK